MLSLIFTLTINPTANLFRTGDRLLEASQRLLRGPRCDWRPPALERLLVDPMVRLCGQLVDIASPAEGLVPPPALYSYSAAGAQPLSGAERVAFQPLGSRLQPLFNPRVPARQHSPVQTRLPAWIESPAIAQPPAAQWPPYPAIAHPPDESPNRFPQFPESPPVPEPLQPGNALLPSPPLPPTPHPTVITLPALNRVFRTMALLNLSLAQRTEGGRQGLGKRDPGARNRAESGAVVDLTLPFPNRGDVADRQPTVAAAPRVAGSGHQQDERSSSSTVRVLLEPVPTGGMKLVQSGSGIASVLQANLASGGLSATVRSQWSGWETELGSKIAHSSADHSSIEYADPRLHRFTDPLEEPRNPGIRTRPGNPLPGDQLLDALADQLELEFIRTYGSVGG